MLLDIDESEGIDFSYLFPHSGMGRSFSLDGVKNNRDKWTFKISIFDDLVYERPLLFHVINLGRLLFC